MFDIGMSELLVVGVVALIVVGPKDLPGMFRTLGRFTAKARAMGREFSRAMEAAADESGVKEAGNALKAASNPKKFGLDALDDAADRFEKWDPMSTDDAKDAPPALDPERAEMAKKISDNAAKKATERKAREAAEAAKAETPDAAKTSTTEKPATKKTAAKKPAAKKPAAKKTAAKPATKAAAKKAAPSKKGEA
ncbi:Sec-independent protein translocase protein TatB [Celeribacter sp.]|uniref:Sec-independent protein translocase protein TatB n=1 Tax=Celeribacter sp. TaxID=1890673 RepID=UPI003A9444EE